MVYSQTNLRCTQRAAEAGAAEVKHSAGGKASASGAAPTGAEAAALGPRGTLRQKRCVALHGPAQTAGAGGVRVGSPLWSAAGIPTAAPQQLTLLWPRYLLVIFAAAPIL